MLALYMVESVVAAALYDARHALDLSRYELAALVTLLGNAVIFVVLLQAKAMPYRELMHPSRHSPVSTAMLIVPPVALLVPLLVLVGRELTEIVVRLMPLSRWEEQAFQDMASDSLAAIVAACVLAPVLEEMLFRGIILRAFLLQYPRGKAILGSALIFGFAHLNVYQFVVAFGFGALAGWLYERTRSLIPCIALHALYNTAVGAYGAMARAAAPGMAGDAGRWLVAGALALLGAGLLVRVLHVAAPVKAVKAD